MRRLGVRVRAASTFAVTAICLTLLARSNAGGARLPFPNPLGNPQDIAVRAALSEFGKAVGAQLPIVLSPSDALPTANLPGPPFAAGITPNITRSLRASTDGTVELQPGDYEFTVDVFCMKASAHSPAAHRYVVAPLRGAAADVFSALNSRAPSYRPNHMALQVLSWDIQGGLPYGEMRAPQRALVDQIIPDYRQRLQGDVLTRMQAKYQEIVGRVPGMPSFDEALGRIGQVGQDVIAMRQLRQQMAQPPPTVEELVRELVPFAPLEPGGSGPTPWSRYSDQVYVRFLTTGNFATPGTYQVRVLAPNQIGGATMLALGPPGSGAPVPFSNIVNNPGTPSVQPLTQGPQAGHGPPPTPAPSPTPTPAATIASQTYATEPADRSRLTVGVGEPVKLTFSGKSATWSLSGSGGKISPNGKTCEYTASITPATETITAVDTTTNAKATITFDVIAPSGLYFERVPGTLPEPDFYHHQGWPDIGFAAKVYLKPETVSFEYIEVREQNADFMATGYYSWNDGKPHGDPSQAPETVTKLVTGKGWELEHEDSIWSGRKQGPAFTPGYESVHIPWEYTAAGESGPYNVFAFVWQVCEFKSNGRLTAEKGNADITLTISSPNYK